MKRIYLDYAATTPVDERVIDAMLPYFKENFGNPSSIHGYGQISDSALDKSRRSIAAGSLCAWFFLKNGVSAAVVSRRLSSELSDFFYGVSHPPYKAARPGKMKRTRGR